MYKFVQKLNFVMSTKNAISTYLKGVVTSIINPASYKNNGVIEKNGGTYFYPIIDPNYKTIENKALIEWYETIPELNSIINFALTTISNVPVKHYKIKSNNELKEIKDSDIIKLLNYPNSQQQGDEFTKQNLLYYLLLGNSYINKVGSIGFNGYYELWTLPAQYTKIDTVGAINYIPQKIDWRITQIKSYDVIINNKELKFKPETIIHFKDVNSSFKDGKYLYGNSRVSSASKALTSLASIYDAKVTYYQKRGMMGILVDQTDPTKSLPMDSKEAKDVSDAINRKYGFGNNRDIIAVTNKNLRFEQISMPFASLRTSENALEDFRTLCKVYGFSSRLLSDPDASTYNNLPSDLKSFYINLAKPVFNDYNKTLSIGLGLTEKNEILMPDWSQVEALQGDDNVKANKNSTNVKTILAVKESIQKGDCTVEEAKAILEGIGMDKDLVNKIIT